MLSILSQSSTSELVEKLQTRFSQTFCIDTVNLPSILSQSSTSELVEKFQTRFSQTFCIDTVNLPSILPQSSTSELVEKLQTRFSQTFCIDTVNLPSILPEFEIDLEYVKILHRAEKLPRKSTLSSSACQRAYTMQAQFRADINTVMFDPAAMPIRSCIRPIDELLSNCGPPHRKNVRFADPTTNQTSPTHPRAWRIKRSKLIPETTPTTPLTLISSQRSENSIRPIDELLSNCGPPHRKNVRFADPTTNQTSPTHPRAWRIKRSKPIPETTPTTPLTLISSQRSENSERTKKLEGTKTVKFSFIERDILPNGQVSESVISFNETNEYWKPGALDDKPYIMNCRTTR